MCRSLICVDEVGSVCGCRGNEHDRVGLDLLGQTVVHLDEGVGDVTVGGPHVQDLLVPVLKRVPAGLDHPWNMGIKLLKTYKEIIQRK